MPRPSTVLRWATNVLAGLVGRVEPNAGKKDVGFVNGEAPPAGEHNWLFGIAGDWISYLDDERASAKDRLDTLDAQAALKNAANVFTQPQTVPSLTATGAINADGEIQAGGHLRSGGSIYTGVGGQVRSDTHVIAGDDIISDNGYVKAAEHVEAPLFRYAATAPERTTALPLARGVPTQDPATARHPWRRDPFGEWVSTEDGALICFPIELPAGAVLRRIDVLHYIAGAANSIVLQTRTAQWVTNAAATADNQAFGAPDARDPFSISQLSPNATIDAQNEYEIRFIALTTGAVIMNIRLVWTDPGPRNH